MIQQLITRFMGGAAHEPFIAQGLGQVVNRDRANPAHLDGRVADLADAPEASDDSAGVFIWSRTV